MIGVFSIVRRGINAYANGDRFCDGHGNQVMVSPKGMVEVQPSTQHNDVCSSQCWCASQWKAWRKKREKENISSHAWDCKPKQDTEIDINVKSTEYVYISN